MRLINGRGQLGKALAKLAGPDVFVYHTWNVTDKTEEVQRACYERFIQFRQTNAGRLVLISTSSANDNAYVKYKRLAEQLADGSVRLPAFIGHHSICERLRDDPATETRDTIELLSVDEAAAAVVAYLCSGRTDVVTVLGTKIPAPTVKELILFGATR